MGKKRKLNSSANPEGNFSSTFPRLNFSQTPSLLTLFLIELPLLLPCLALSPIQSNAFGEATGSRGGCGLYAQWFVCSSPLLICPSTAPCWFTRFPIWAWTPPSLALVCQGCPSSSLGQPRSHGGIPAGQPRWYLPPLQLLSSNPAI